MLARRFDISFWNEIASSSAEAIRRSETCSFPTPLPKESGELPRRYRPLCGSAAAFLAPSDIWPLQCHLASDSTRIGRPSPWNFWPPMGSFPRNTNSLWCVIWIGLTTTSTSSGAGSEATGASSAIVLGTGRLLSKFAGRWRSTSAFGDSPAASKGSHLVSRRAGSGNESDPPVQSTRCANVELFPRLTTSATGLMPHGHRRAKCCPFGP